MVGFLGGCGREEGIRSLGRVNYTDVPGLHLRPLGHLSKGGIVSKVCLDTLYM